MTLSQDFRDRLARGHVLLGPAVPFSDPRVTEALAPSADFIWLEQEHSLMSPEAVVGHVLAARATNTPLLLRIPVGSTALIKPALDSGVPGLIIPQSRTVDEIEGVVADVRYAPVGRRGIAPLRGSNYGRIPLDAVIAADDPFLAIQIETTEALAAVEKIAAIPGIDALVIGPTDLSSAMGLLGDFDHPRMRAAITEIVAAARANGLSVGAGVGTAATARSMIDKGIQWLQLSGADAFLWQRFEQLRAEVG